MRFGSVALLMIVATVASGCGQMSLKRAGRAQIALPFDASVKAESNGYLTVQVKRAGGAGLDAVRESARYPVTQYCLFNRGSSEADWDINPANGDWAYRVDERGDLTLRAKCRA